MNLLLIAHEDREGLQDDGGYCTTKETASAIMRTVNLVTYAVHLLVTRLP